MKAKQTFEEYLRKDNLSKNTITSYLWTVNYYTENYDAVSKENLLAYKGYLMEFFKPKTVNLRIQAINKYLEYLDKQQLQLKAVKVQQKNFLENVISNADYNFLKKQLKKDHWPPPSFRMARSFASEMRSPAATPNRMIIMLFTPRIESTAATAASA